MKASLIRPWWQKIGLPGQLAAIGVLAVAAYIFDPPARELGTFSGQVLSIATVENSKTGFRQLASVRLASGGVIRAAVPSSQIDLVPVGAKVTIHEFSTLLFHKRSYRAALIELRPNNSFKPKPIRGSA